MDDQVRLARVGVLNLANLAKPVKCDCLEWTNALPKIFKAYISQLNMEMLEPERPLVEHQ